MGAGGCAHGVEQWGWLENPGVSTGMLACTISRELEAIGNGPKPGVCLSALLKKKSFVCHLDGVFALGLRHRIVWYAFSGKYCLSVEAMTDSASCAS